MGAQAQACIRRATGPSSMRALAARSLGRMPSLLRPETLVGVASLRQAMPTSFRDEVEVHGIPMEDDVDALMVADSLRHVHFVQRRDGSEDVVVERPWDVSTHPPPEPEQPFVHSAPMSPDALVLVLQRLSLEGWLGKRSKADQRGWLRKRSKADQMMAFL